MAAKYLAFDIETAKIIPGQVAADLVRYLVDAGSRGYTVLSWNGLGFDFDILAEESGLIDECRQLARLHVDMMFHAFCELGYPIGLDRAGQGMGLPGKLAGVPQHLVPQYWADGRCDEVLQYVSQDVRLTLELALACDKRRALRWIAHSGKARECRLQRGWLSVDAAMRLAAPDTSWMRDPIPRTRFTQWLQS